MRHERDAPLLFPLERQFRRRFIQPDPEALQLLFDEQLVRDGLQDVQHDEDEAGGARGGDDLPAPPLPVRSTLDDPRQVQHLQSSGFHLADVVSGTLDMCQGRWNSNLEFADLPTCLFSTTGKVQ